MRAVGTGRTDTVSALSQVNIESTVLLGTLGNTVAQRLFVGSIGNDRTYLKLLLGH